MSKGSKQRPTDSAKFSEGHDRIFGASSVTSPEYKEAQESMNTAARNALDAPEPTAREAELLEMVGRLIADRDDLAFELEETQDKLARAKLDALAVWEIPLPGELLKVSGSRKAYRDMGYSRIESRIIVLLNFMRRRAITKDVQRGLMLLNSHNEQETLDPCDQ